MRLNQTTINRRKTGLIGYDKEQSARGFTLFAPQTGNGRVTLIDMFGNIEHEWHMPVRPGRDAVLLPNGNLGYNGSHKESAKLYPAWDIWHGGHFMEATPKGDIVWEHEDIYHHHDAIWLDNGNLIYAVAEEVFVSPIGPVISDRIKEVNRKGEVVWEWCVWEHIFPHIYKTHECFNTDHWPMVNGIFQRPDGNSIALSLRTTSGIIIVNKITKEITWELKYPFVAQQHDPSFTDSGTIICFDNGNIRPNSIHHSRIVEYSWKTKQLVWEYKDEMPPSFFSSYMGSAQRLWNGNTFICESAFGRLFEVNVLGDVVWEYVIPYFAEYPEPLNEFITGEHNSCFKAHRYPSNDKII